VNHNIARHFFNEGGQIMALRNTLLIAAAGVVLAFPCAALAQPGQVQRGGIAGSGRGADYGRLYDPQTVETVAGDVVEVFTVESPRDASGHGVHIRLRTDREIVPVHLGPEWYVQAQDLQIESGERITVTGSRVMLERQPVLLAAMVQRGDGDVLIFRDDDGFPRWSIAARGRQWTTDRDGWWRDEYVRIFDPATVESVDGTIIEHGSHTPRKSPGLGRYLKLRKADESHVMVHLGPDWFLRRQIFGISVGDDVTVTGSNVQYDGERVMVAAELRTDNHVLELRDARGTPKWSAARRAQRPVAPRGIRSRARDADFVRMYDPNRVRTLQGTVSEIEYLTLRGSIGRGVHLTLQTDSGPVEVHLGPEWYLENQELLIDEGDRVTIIGSLIMLEGDEMMVAATVRKGRDMLELRDERGIPRWRGWRRDAAGM
jgi:hypothetical protein